SGGNPHYYMERGQAYAGMGNHHNAITDIQHFLTYYPDCIKAMEFFTIYAVALGRNIDALFRLATLIKAKPNEVKYYLLRSKIYISSQSWAVAEKDLSKAIGIDGKLVEAYMQRGLCYLNMGNKEAACKDWKQAQTLGKFEAQELIYKHCR
ncbi:MAG TPA: tetratricopeptide repeat protein, partial [Tenuifilaceae bacterium]|nr:tetratricopeptide repeat protein [Tenuifilaceae bacterium]